MIDLFVRNYELIEKHRPALVPLIDAYIEKMPDYEASEEDCRTMQAGARKMWQEQKWSAPPKLLFIQGLMSGYALSEMVLPKWTRTVAIIEPDAGELFLAMHIHDMEPFLSRDDWHWIVCNNIDLIRHALNVIFSEGRCGGSQYFDCSQIVVAPYCHEEYVQLHRDIYQSCSRSFQLAVALNGNSNLDQWTGFANSFENLSKQEGMVDMSQYAGCASGVLGVSVSSGPSLTAAPETLRWLKRMQLENRVVIVAADSSVKPLISRGIHPHFATIIERTSCINPYIPEDLGQSIKTVLVAASVVSPKTLALWPGQRGVVFRPENLADVLEQAFPSVPRIEMMPDVGNANAGLLRYLGCKKIVLLGQDYAYAPEGKETHFAGCPALSVQSPHGKDKYTHMPSARAWNGEIETMHLWEMYRQTMLKNINWWKQQEGIDTYHVAPKGWCAKLSGATEIEPKDLDERLAGNQYVHSLFRIEPTQGGQKQQNAVEGWKEQIERTATEIEVLSCVSEMVDASLVEKEMAEHMKRLLVFFAPFWFGLLYPWAVKMRARLFAMERDFWGDEKYLALVREYIRDFSSTLRWWSAYLTAQFKEDPWKEKQD